MSLTPSYLQSFVTFTNNGVGGTDFVFHSKRFQGFVSEILGAVSLLGESSFFNSFGTNEISRIFKIFNYFHVVLRRTFKNN